VIRPATFLDIGVLTAMLHEMYARSKYAGRVAIKPKLAEQTLMAMVAGQGQHGPQGSFLHIAEQDGKPAGFMAGVLQPIYFIGDKLEAQDAFLYARDGAKASVTLRLIDAYIEWALGNRRVIEIKLSWNDTLPGAERIAAVYQRKGFERIGEIYEMRVDTAQGVAA